MCIMIKTMNYRRGIICFYIGIDDLVANALIRNLNQKNKQFITYEEKENYDVEVIGILSLKGEKALI